MHTEKKKTVIWTCCLSLAAVLNLIFSVHAPAAGTIDGCGVPIHSVDYAGWGDLSRFNISNLHQNADGHLAIDTAGVPWNQDGIATATVRDISVTYLYRDSDAIGAKLGWLYEKDVNANGGPDAGKIRWIYDNLDGAPGADTQAMLADRDGLALRYGSDERIVFVLGRGEGDLYYTKSSWNAPFASGCSAPATGFAKKILFYENSSGASNVCRDFTASAEHQVDGAPVDSSVSYDSQGWLSDAAIARLGPYGYTFSQNDANYVESMMVDGAPAPRSIFAAPDNTRNALILGFEAANSLYDFNDVAFLVTFKISGIIQLKNEAAMTPEGHHGFYTQIEFEACDGISPDVNGAVTYYYAVNYLTDPHGEAILDPDGNKIPVWHRIEPGDWREVYSFTAEDGSARLTDSNAPDTNGTQLESWSMGSPAFTCRKAVIDLVSRSLIGRDLLWKAELDGGDANAVPVLVDVKISAMVSQETISRSVPVVQTNVVYSGSFELPDYRDTEWFNDPEPRGHLKAIKIYDPETSRAAEARRSVLWDAGVTLSERNIGTSPRKIYFPYMTEDSHTEDLASEGGGVYSGNFAHVPVLDGTLTIKLRTDTDTVTLMRDGFSGNTFSTDAGGGASGEIDLDSGRYTVRFDTVPDTAIQIFGEYKSYSLDGSSSLRLLGMDNVSDALLNIDTSQLTNSELIRWILGYKKNGAADKRTWLLGAVDHSAPAVMTPPGFPEWFFGAAFTEDTITDFNNAMKTAFYDPAEPDAGDTTFRARHQDRDVVIFVGSRSGMLHAFDGGKFSWKDNEKTIEVEHRGHFVWAGDTQDTAQYGSGRELWAYIPGNLLGKMKNNYANTGENEAWLDASPALGDVYTDGSWRTVLITCQGNGGHMVTCLDVTDPSGPALLWEISDPGLINSRTSPVIGMIDTGKWVAFLLSGSTESGHDPAIFMIDIETGGKTIIPLDAAGAEGRGGVGSGQPAAVDSDGDGYLDRLYVGTDKGFMYRVEIDNGFFSDIVINSTGRNANEGIYGSPAALADTDGVRVFFGTGGNDSATTYHFYGYLDNKKGDSDNPLLKWSYALPAGHRVYASTFAVAGQVYFSTTTAVTEDPCEAGGGSEGKLYAFKQVLESPGASFGPLSKVDLPTGSGRVAPIIDDQHLYIKTAFGTLLSFGGDAYNNEAAGVSGGEIAVPVPKATIYSWKEVR